jgi:hypothetical protein
MPKLILISPSGVWNSAKNAFYPNVVESLRLASDEGSAVFLISNHQKPAWLTDDLDFFTFQQCGLAEPRSKGKIIKDLIELNKKNGLHSSDVIVLGANNDDLFMAANSQTMLIRCDWVHELGDRIKDYGVPLKKATSIPQLVRYLNDAAPWHFRYESEFTDVYAVTKAGNKDEADTDFIRLIEQLRKCLKDGDPTHHKPFLLHFLSSLYATEVFREVDVWSYYPSSDSANDGSEVMAGFCTHARTIFKKRTDGPLFIRHKPVGKRHHGNTDRLDPSDQLDSIHLNPAYERKIKGKVVAVLDDYLTYGVSFGVSAALLKKAGAKKVIAVAMGKYGNVAHLYDIEIKSKSVFAPISEYTVKSTTRMAGACMDEAKAELLKKFGKAK